MDPITVSTALGLAKLLGLDNAIGKLFNSDKAGEVAGKVISAAQIVTGSTSIADMEKAIKGDSELAAKLRTQVLEIAERAEEREAQDRANARALQAAALRQDDVFSKRFLYYFATAWSLFAMGYILAITMIPIDPTNLRFADTILGFLLGTIVPTIIYYFFGSSKSSQRKDDTMAEMAGSLRK